MSDHSFLRERSEPELQGVTNARLTCCTFPFNDLPVIESHLHPCFAICHAGRFQKQLVKFSEKNAPPLFLRLTAMMVVYRSWMSREPDPTFYESPAPNDNHSESDRTERRRLDQSPRLLRRRKRSSQNSPLAKRTSKKRRGSGSPPQDSSCAGQFNLQSLNAMYSPHNNNERQRVHDWVSNINGERCIKTDIMCV